jgi:hypothetical protein
MGRKTQPFTLAPAELAALEVARAQFLAWHDGLPALQPKVLSELREAARMMSKALVPVLDAANNATASRLLVRMQEVELCQQAQGHYSDLLQMAAYTAGLVDKACALDVRPGKKADARAHTWVRTAAAAWQAGGLPVRPAGRFGLALAAYAVQGIPPVTDPDQVRAALRE